MAEYANRLGRVVAPGKVDYIGRTVQPPKGKQVLIKIAASAICGSDLHIFKGKHPSAPLPVTIGHEFSGIVEATGEEVTKIKPGDRVTVEPVIVCGHCPACLRGEYGYCENISFTYRNGDGAMADYITILEPYIYKLPESLSFEEGALIEPLAVATHAVKRADIRLGEKVVIFGAGAIGLLIAALCRKRGATDVAVVDLVDARLETAREFGATHAINPSSCDVLSEIAAWSGGGADKTFECVGVQATFLQAMLSLRKNGLATIIGIFENPEVTIPATRFITHEIKVQGSQGYCWDFPVALALAPELGIGRLITNRFALDELQSALECCLDRTSGAVKVLIKP
jgi:threonine dehydrogenase-like Zn-dependent dehydrogenase